MRHSSDLISFRESYTFVFMSGDDAVLPTLVELYLKCFAPLLGEDLPEIMSDMAANIFRYARKPMSEYF